MMRNYTTKQAADIIGIKPSTLEVYRVYGKGPRFCRIGRKVLYPEDELRAYLDGLKRFQNTSEKA